MGPPGGGRNPVSARLLRHYHYLAFPEIQDDSKVSVSQFRSHFEIPTSLLLFGVLKDIGVLKYEWE